MDPGALVRVRGRWFGSVWPDRRAHTITDGMLGVVVGSFEVTWAEPGTWRPGTYIIVMIDDVPIVWDLKEAQDHGLDVIARP